MGAERLRAHLRRLLLLGGRAADLLGRRRVFMVGFRPAAATRSPGHASQPSGRQSKGLQKGGEPGVLPSCQPGRQGPATRDASPGQPAAPGTTGPCAGQGISACRTGPTAGPRGGAQGSAAARRTQAMTPLPAGHARPHRVPDQAHPGSSPAPRERAPPPDHGGGAPCRAERLRRPMVRRRSAGSGRRLTIRRRQHTHQAHRAVDQNESGRRAFSRATPVTQRHTGDWHHLEADP